MAPPVRSPAHQKIPPYTTCSSLEIPYGLVCSVCKVLSDPLIHKQRKRKTERCKSKRKQCKALWLKSNCGGCTRTSGEQQLHRLQCRYLGIEFEQDDKELTLKVRSNCNPILDQSEDLPAQVAPSSKLIPPRPKDFPWHTIRTGYESDVENWITLQHMKELPFESSSKKRKIISDCNNDIFSRDKHNKHPDLPTRVIITAQPVDEDV